MQTSFRLCLVAWSALAAPGWGADLVQPWPLGFSNVEFYLLTERGRRPTISALLGGGMTERLSVGLAAARREDEQRLAAVALLSLPPRGAAEVDLWLEVGGSFLPREAEEGSACLTAGGEASWATATGLTPYLRLTASQDGNRRTVHPLAGVMVPLGTLVRLHLEVSSEKEGGQSWPLHLAVGPNFPLGEGIMLLTELSHIRPGGGGRPAWAGMVGVILDPQVLRR